MTRAYRLALPAVRTCLKGLGKLSERILRGRQQRVQLGQRLLVQPSHTGSRCLEPGEVLAESGTAPSRKRHRTRTPQFTFARMWDGPPAAPGPSVA